MLIDLKYFQFLLIMTLLFNSSCSSSKIRKNNRHKVKNNNPISAQTPSDDKIIIKKAEISDDQKAVFLEAEKKIGDLITEAQKNGPESVQFLASDLYFKATDASIRGDAHSAAFIYKYIYKLYPDDIYLQKKYSVELIRLGQLEEAEKILLNIFENKKIKQEEEIGLVLGGLYTAMENLEQAKVVYQKVLKAFPKSEEACVFLSKSLALEKKTDDAYRNLDQCQKKSDRKGIFSYYKGKIALSEGKKDLAAQYFKDSLKSEPDYYQAALGLGLLMEEKEKFVLAASIYTAFLKNNPGQYAILSRLVQVLFATGKFKEVIPYAEALSNIDTADLNLKVRLGILYSDSKKFAEAKRVFNEVLAVMPDSDKIIYYMAALEQETGNLDKAIQNYAKINEESPLFGDAQVQIATLLSIAAIEMDSKELKEESEKKLLSFIKSKENNENKVELLAVLASYYESENRLEEAANSLQPFRGQKGFTDEHDYYLATLYEKLGDLKKSRGIISEVLQKNPDNPHALNFLGYSYIENNENFDEAYKLISHAVKLRPEDGYVRDSMGWYYYKIGDLKKALIEVKKAFEKVKNDVVIAKHLAIIYGDLKNFKMAKKYFLEALKNCKLNSERSEIVTAIQKFGPLRFPASFFQELNPEIKK